MADSLEYHKTLQELLEDNLTLSLGTLNERGQTEVSLTPFLYHQGRFWIFVSELSKHTQHLHNDPEVSVLVHSIEGKVSNPFAIERLSVSCEARREEDNRDQILDFMTVKLGKSVALLRQLGDFQLFSLTPIQGRLIAGFGQAFEVNFSTMSFKHIKGSNNN